jgi:hypothetical protein
MQASQANANPPDHEARDTPQANRGMRSQPLLRVWALRFIALSIGVCSALLCGEIGLRVLGISYPLPYQTDPNCGTKLQPNFTAHFMKEGRAWVQTTSDGRRDREYPLQKSPNTFRIAILGDSYAEALQVELEETFWSVLQTELSGCDSLKNQQIEVLNFGTSGFGTAQELQMLEHYLWAYQPDLVLLAFLTGNDISDNSKALSSNPVRPFYQLVDDQLVLDDSFLQHPTYLAANSSWGKTKTAAINGSRILQLLRETSNRWQARTKPNPSEAQVEDGLDPIYAAPKSKDWQDAWAVTEKLLQKMFTECEQHRCKFCVVTLTNAIQVEPDRRKREKAQQASGLEHLFYPDFRIADLGKRDGFCVFNLAPSMQVSAEETQTYFHGFSNTQFGTGHWNRDGHRFAGQWIAKELCNFLDTDVNITQTP